MYTMSAMMNSTWNKCESSMSIKSSLISQNIKRDVDFKVNTRYKVSKSISDINLIFLASNKSLISVWRREVIEMMGKMFSSEKKMHEQEFQLKYHVTASSCSSFYLSNSFLTLIHTSISKRRVKDPWKSSETAVAKLQMKAIGRFKTI